MCASIAFGHLIPSRVASNILFFHIFYLMIFQLQQMLLLIHSNSLALPFLHYWTSFCPCYASPQGYVVLLYDILSFFCIDEIFQLCFISRFGKNILYVFLKRILFNSEDVLQDGSKTDPWGIKSS